MSKDGDLVIFHDEDMKRIAGIDKKIKDMNLNEIQAIDIGKGEKIPTLKNVFSSLPKDALINIEIKDIDAVSDILKLVEIENAKDRVMLSSFNIDALRVARKIDDEILIGLLVDKEETIPMVPQLKDELKLYSVNIPIDALTLFPIEKLREAILWLRAMNLKIVFWAEKDYLYYENNNIEKFKGIVDIVITDDVVKMREHLFHSTKD
jgi:glycerophosphoryl diester phosphodiesterase